MNSGRTAFVFLNIHDPLVAWLVYRAEMVSALEAHPQAVSFWMTGYLANAASSGKGSARYQQELAIEGVRQAHYSNEASRLKGFYAFPDRKNAFAAAQSWGGSFRKDFLAEVGLKPGARTSTYDAEWITHKLDSGETSWIPDYLQGRPYGSAPIWELVVEGRALIFGTDLRKRAYDVVKRAWPKSLALLELARVGVEFGSDLGLITGMVLSDGNNLVVKYVMNFVDATDPEFLARFGSFQGPKNTSDLNSQSELVTPDLRSREFTF